MVVVGGALWIPAPVDGAPGQDGAPADAAAAEAVPAPADRWSGTLPPATTDTGPARTTALESVASVRFDGAAHGASALVALPPDGPGLPLVLAGYSRHDGSDPLGNERRAAVHQAVLDSPGTYLTEVAESTGIHVSTVRYHVRVLEDEDLVRTAKVGGKRRLYPAQVEQEAVRAALNDASTAPVLETVAEQEPASVSAIAAAVDRAVSTVSHHVSRLADAGVVVRERDGQSVQVTLASTVRPVVEAHRSVEATAD